MKYLTALVAILLIPSTLPQSRVRVSTSPEGQAQPQKPQRVRVPTYRAESITRHIVLPKDVGIPGEAVLEVLVGKDGKVLDLREVAGDSRLVRASKSAVSKWTFSPYFLNGEPVQFLTNLTIQFDGKKGSAKLKIEDDPFAPRNPQPK